MKMLCIAAASLFFAACADPKSEHLRWGACPEGFQTECARVRVPLDWNRPDDATIELLMARRPAVNAEAQLWLLEGGPGGSGADFLELIDRLAVRLPRFDIYTLDHRGVGHSTRLGCSTQEAPYSTGGARIVGEEWPACLASLRAEWGDDGLEQFSTTNAARDLGHLIEITRGREQNVFIYGVSYGSLWATRYLTLFPAQAQGVVLDSVLPESADATKHASQFDPVLRAYTDLCAADVVCAEKLGRDPWAFLERLYDKVDAGHCPQLFQGAPGRPILRAAMSEMLSSGWATPVFGLALAYRIDRCSPQDVNAVRWAFGKLGRPDARSLLFSMALNHNIAFQEGWISGDISEAMLQERLSQTLSGSDWNLSLGAVANEWPRPPRNEYTTKWPENETPVFMLNGTLDPLTPVTWAEEAAAHLHGPDQQLVIVPNAAHAVIANSPLRSSPDHCGMKLFESFLRAPAGPLDKSCLDDLLPISFTCSSETAQAALGTRDLWEN